MRRATNKPIKNTGYLKMKKLSLVAALALGGLIACSTLATAQDSTNNVPKKGKRGFQTVEQQMQRYTDQLTLTDEQKAEGKGVAGEALKKGSENLGRSNLGRADNREKKEAIMDEQNKKMK